MRTAIKRIAIFFVCVAMVLWVTGPVTLQPGWYYSHDAWNPYRLAQFSLSFREGHFYPRWMSHMLGGNGYPTFVFYQPGFFFLALPFTYLTDALTACKIAIVIVMCTGMAGAYAIARLWHPRWLSLCLAILFLFSRYSITNLSIRSDLTELTAMMFCPWNLYFLLDLARRGKAGQTTLPSALGLMVSTLLIIISHLFVAALWLPFAAGFLLFLTLPAPADKRSAIAGAISLLIAVVLASPYWFSVLQMKGDVPIDKALPSFARFLSNFNRAHHLIDNSDQSLYFLQEYGCFLAALAGFALSLKLWQARFALLFFLAYSFLMTEASIPLWSALFPVVHFLQFDWRLLAPLITIRYWGLVLLAVPLMRLHAQNQQGALLAVLLTVLLTGGIIVAQKDLFHLYWPITGKTGLYPLDYHQSLPDIERNTLIYANGDNEFLPKTADFDALTNRLATASPIASLAGGEGTLSIHSDGEKSPITLQVTSPKETTLIIHQLYFPGWKVEVEGQNTAIHPTPEGFISLPLASGEHHIQAWYDGPPHWQWRNAVSALLLLLLVPALLRHTSAPAIDSMREKKKNPSALFPSV